MPTDAPTDEDKLALEKEKLRLEISDLQTPFWRRNIGFFGTVIAALLAFGGTVATNIYTTNTSFYEKAQREAAGRFIQELADADPRVRQNAGRFLAALDPRFNLDALQQAYTKSKELVPTLRVSGPSVQPPTLRVGAIEAIALGPVLWKRTQRELIGIVMDGAFDPSPLVRQKAIHVLTIWGEKAEVDRLYRQEADALKARSRERDGMLLIAGGIAVIGSDVFEPSESPAHERDVRAFWIDREEVSTEQWNAAMKQEEPLLTTTLSAHRKRRLDPLYAKHPVFGVSFAQAKRYCSLTGGRRLPTEIEWEVAARGLSGWTFPWGEDDSQAKTLVELDQSTQDRNREKWTVPWELNTMHAWDRSPYGLLSMGAGVLEWTDTELTPDHKRALKACTKLCVLRGGAGNEYVSYNQPTRFRTTRRLYRSPTEADDNIGFRCARDEIKK